MEEVRPMACVGKDSKHGFAKNAYEATIRDLNRTIYDLYQRIEKLTQEKDELSKLRKSEHKPTS
jgi:prefoldin subunit 5